MRILKIITTVLLIAFVLLSIRNMFLLKRFKSRIKKQSEEIAKCHADSLEVENALIKSQFASMTHLGRTLTWMNIEKLYPTTESGEDIPQNPRLVLLFSEFGCNVCQDNETRFAVEIADEFGENFVLAVVQAGNERYVRNYIRMNQVNFPVYHCKDDLFFTENKVKNTPMILFLDEDDRVIASHFPLPGHPEFSEPIHRFCSQYLKQYIDSTGK